MQEAVDERNGMWPIAIAEDIRKALECCVAQEIRARLTVDDGEWTIVKFVEVLADGVSYRLRNVDDHAFNLGAQKLSLRFLLFGVPFLIEEGLQWIDYQTLRLIEPTRIFVAGRRSKDRLRLPPGTSWLEWSGADKTRAEVRDFSGAGLRVRIPEQTMTLPLSGAFAARLSLDGNVHECLVEPRYARRARGGRGYDVGLRLSGANGVQDALIRAYRDRSLPSLRPRRFLPATLVRDLMLESRYLSLREGCEPTEHWYTAPWKDEDSMDVVYRDGDDRLIGHISVTRAYPNAWLGHQLATLKGHKETAACRRDLYLHVTTWPRLMDDEDTMLIGYFDRGKAWHRWYFESFIKWVGSAELAVLFPWDRFEQHLPDARIPNIEFPASTEVGPLRDEERDEAVDLVSRFLPSLAKRAFAIDADTIVGTLLPPKSISSTYDRNRHGIALRVNTKLVGLALCETGSRDISLFNLLNLAQLYIRNDCERPSEAAQLALLTAVRTFYRTRGVTTPLVVAPPDTLAATAEPGTFLAEKMGCIIWSGHSLKHYENFIRFQFGRFISTREREVASS